MIPREERTEPTSNDVERTGNERETSGERTTGGADGRLGAGDEACALVDLVDSATAGSVGESVWAEREGERHRPCVFASEIDTHTTGS